MTDLHDDTPGHHRHGRSRREPPEQYDRLITHDNQSYPQSRHQARAGTSWSTPSAEPDAPRGDRGDRGRWRPADDRPPRPDRERPRPRPQPYPRPGPDFRDPDGRYGRESDSRYGRTDRRSEPARTGRQSYPDDRRGYPDQRDYQPQPRPYPEQPAEYRRTADQRDARGGGGRYGSAGLANPETGGQRRHPSPYPSADLGRVPVGYAGGVGAAREASGYAAGYGSVAPDEAVRYGDDQYDQRYAELYGGRADRLGEQRDWYTDDPYPDDDPYGSPPDEPGGRHRRGSDGGGGRGWAYYAKRVGAVFGVLVLLAGGYLFYEYKHLDGNIKRVDVLQTHDKNIRQAEKQRNAENFLLIGSDTRAGANSKFGENVEGARSDTTILAHLSPNGARAILISIPRDSWVDIPPCVQPNGSTTVEQRGQFNAAFSIGGPNCTIRTVQKLTGIAVTHYVQIDFTGFENMVHAIGGITMCSTTDVFDKDSGLQLHKGDNQLDGAQALAYVRARHNLGNGSDLGRIQRQQRFLGAMMRKVTSGDVLLNPIKLQHFLEAATKSVTMDKDTHLGDLKDLATVLHGLDPAKVSFVTPFIANPAYDPNDPSNLKGSRVLLDDDKNRALFDSIINDKVAPPSATPTGAAPKTTAPPVGPKITVPPEEVRVYVYNGVGTNRLAHDVAASLGAQGFTIADTGNQGTDVATTEVHYGPGHLDAARTLAQAVPGSVLVEDSHYQRSVAVILGANYTSVQQVHVGDPYTPSSGGSGAGGSSPAPHSGPITPTNAINAADTSCGS